MPNTGKNFGVRKGAGVGREPETEIIEEKEGEGGETEPKEAEDEKDENWESDDDDDMEDLKDFENLLTGGEIPTGDGDLDGDGVDPQDEAAIDREEAKMAFDRSERKNLKRREALYTKIQREVPDLVALIPKSRTASPLIIHNLITINFGLSYIFRLYNGKIKQNCEESIPKLLSLAPPL
jgi:hypothetical protein